MLFRKNVEKVCAWCIHAGQSGDGRMLCAKKGFVAPDGKCWRFCYDPLKREPTHQKAKDFSKFKEEDFKL